MKGLLIGLVVVIAFFVYIYYFTPSENNERCQWQHYFNHLVINGIVVNKYIDKSNHSVPVIQVKNTGSDSIKEIDLLGDKTNAFNLISKLDTLHKSINNDTIFIKKSGVYKMLVKVDFDCR